MKLLTISTIGLNYNGITMVIYNYLSQMDRKDIKMEFISFLEMDRTLKTRFTKLGNVKLIKSRKTHFFQYLWHISQIIQNKYDIVHIHGNSGTMAIEVLLCKFYGVKKIIVHGHNTKTLHPIVNQLLKGIMLKFADINLACSEDVGKWLYKGRKYLVLNNAIDIPKFKYNDENRAVLRKKYNIGNEVLVGHIGHFNKQKNHSFLIDVFYEYLTINPNAKLVLIGNGSGYNNIKEKVRCLKIESKVLFLGYLNDPYKYYSMMDILLFPSLHEGLPIVTLEAQAAELPILASTAVTKEAICTNLFYQKSLSCGKGSWAKGMSYLLKQSGRRGDSTNIVFESITKRGFNISEEAKKLRNIYMQ